MTQSGLLRIESLQIYQIIFNLCLHLNLRIFKTVIYKFNVKVVKFKMSEL